TRSAATCTGSADASARIAISVGPASASMPSRPRSSRLAATTQMLPGPVTIGARGHDCVPYANIATAWAPPTAYTSVTPSSAQTARIVGCGRPPWARCGGLATAIEGTPATCAGTTFMTTLLASGATPPGTYSPTRRTGTQRSVTLPPGTTCVVVSVR